MKVLLIVLFFVVVISKKSAVVVVQGWRTTAFKPFVVPIIDQNQHYHHHLCNSAAAATADNDGSTSDDASPEWKGSTYSWTPPAKARKRRRKTNGTRAAGAVITSIPIEHACDGCSTIIEIEEHPEDEILDSSTDRTGVILWSAAYSLAEYIDAQCHQRESWSIENQPRTCLELGAGLGLPSIVAAKHGWNCILTERDPQVLPLLERNLKRNNLHVSPSEQQESVSSPTISIESLDWTSPEQVQELTAKYPSVDLIVASDLIYAQTRPVWKDLLSVINQLRRGASNNRPSSSQEQERRRQSPLERFDGTCSSSARSSNGDPLVLLGYTQRRRNLDLKAEGEFFALVNAMGMQAVIVPVDQVPNSDKRLLTILFELRWKTNDETLELEFSDSQEGASEQHRGAPAVVIHAPFEHAPNSIHIEGETPSKPIIEFSCLHCEC